MEHQNLLYYQNITELEDEQGTGGTVTTVRPGVAYEHEMKGVRYNKKKTTYFVTVNYKRINGTTIESSTTIETLYVMPGKTTKVKINAIDIEGYAPVSDSVKLLVSADTSYDYLYKMYTAYTVTVNYVDASGETIACATTITTDEVPETDEVRVTITPETISGYRYTGETPIVIWVSGDTEYDIEYVEGPSYEAIDLGLPSGTLWASCNVGASSPEEFGDYYAWGEIETKPVTAYTEEGYRFYNNGNEYTKYNSNDGKTELDLSDDVANVTMGGEWHMPTSAQCSELLNYCQSAITTLNGVDGLQLTSYENGNSIFIPIANVAYMGQIMDNALALHSKTLMSSSVEFGSNNDSYGINYFGGMINLSMTPRSAGTSIRGVIDGESQPLDPGDITIDPGGGEMK